MSDCGIALPQYQCHKKVWALKIAGMADQTIPGNESDGSRRLVFEDARYGDMIVNAEYVRKHNPVVGGWWVRYEDGYESFSPAEAFENGYTKIN